MILTKRNSALLRRFESERLEAEAKKERERLKEAESRLSRWIRLQLFIVNEAL